MSFLRKCWATFRIHIGHHLIYRGQVLIWLTADSISSVVLPMVWLAAFNGRPSIQGYTPSGIVLYYLLTFFLSNFLVSHIMWDIAFDVKEGMLNIYLTRPFSYLAFRFLTNLSWRITRAIFFIPVLLATLYLFRNYLHGAALSLGPAFWGALLLGHVVSYLMTHALGLTALYFVHVRDFFSLYYIVLGVLGGQLVPLAMLPDRLQRAVVWLPFRYMLSFPIEIGLQRLDGGAIALGFAVGCAWLLLAYALCRLLWRNGLRQFSGVGI